MFAPRWKKEARLLYKGAKKFLNYKRDKMEPEKIAEIEEARAELLRAVKANDKEGVQSAEKAVTKACERALPHYRRQNAIEENIEVFFVAIVIALGIRAYFLQPFRIPTGSMQPTLNGIIGHPLEKDKFPALPIKAWQGFVSGKKYIHEKITGDQKRYFRLDPNSDWPSPLVVQGQKMQFFTVTTLYFTDGAVKIGAPRSAIEKMGLKVDRDSQGFFVPPHTTVSGYTSSGDLVLVDKVSYNFRRPRRGEVFVFDTRGIEGIKKRSETPQGAGSHYIKRLIGVPDDSLKIVGSELYIDGKPATEKRIQWVMRGEGPYKGNPGYELARSNERYSNLPRYIDEASDVVNLNTREENMENGMDSIEAYLQREYFAFGDNTTDSLDSRYWGSVKEYNLVGPALFALWPFTSGHWGFIR